MDSIVLRCPSCSANLEFDSSKNIGYCKYCGTKILVRDDAFRQAMMTDYKSDIEKWLASAKVFYENGYEDKIGELAEKIVDADPTNADGWYYKGVVATSLKDRKACIIQAKNNSNDEQFIKLMDMILETLENEFEIRMGEMDKHFLKDFKIVVDDVLLVPDRFVSVSKGKHTFKLINNGTVCDTVTRDVSSDMFVSAKMKVVFLMVLPKLVFESKQ